MRQNTTKTRRANVAFADIGVPVHMRSERHFRIVGVNQLDVLQAQDASDFGDRLVQTGLRGDIESSRQQVAGVKSITNSQVRFTRRQVADAMQLLEPATDLRAASRGILEQHRYA